MVAEFMEVDIEDVDNLSFSYPPAGKRDATEKVKFPVAEATAAVEAILPAALMLPGMGIVATVVHLFVCTVSGAWDAAAAFVAVVTPPTFGVEAGRYIGFLFKAL